MAHRLSDDLTMLERMLAHCYADGWELHHIARAFGTTQADVKETVKRIRLKYTRQGRNAGSRILLGICLADDQREEETP